MTDKEQLAKLKELSSNGFDELQRILNTFQEVIFSLEDSPASQQAVLDVLDHQQDIVGRLIAVHGQFHEFCHELMSENANSRAAAVDLSGMVEELVAKNEAIATARRNIGFRGPSKPEDIKANDGAGPVDTFLDGLSFDAVTEEVLREVRKDLATDKAQLEATQATLLAAIRFIAVNYLTQPPAAQTKMIRMLKGLLKRHSQSVNQVPAMTIAADKVTAKLIDRIQLLQK